jgi:threonine dehydratase
VAQAVNREIRVVGVQSEASPAAYQSWKQKKMVEAPNRTIAEGLATGTAFYLPQAILWEYLKDFILLPDAEILRAMTWMVERAHTLAEAAGAAPLAAAYHLRKELKGKKVGLVCSGGNVSLEQLKQALLNAEGGRPGAE